MSPTTSQVIEGEIDTVHASILHSNLDSLDRSNTATTVGERYSYRDRPARFFVEDTDSGILIGARRNAEDDSYYWRISRFLYPYITMIPREPKGLSTLRPHRAHRQRELLVLLGALEPLPSPGRR